MPLGAARIAFLAKTQVTAVAEVIRRKVGVTAFNNAQVDTAESKFGGASYVGDRSNQTYLDLNDTIVPATGPFTIECWVNLDIVDANTWIVSQYNASEAGRMVLYTGGTNGEFRLFAGSVIVEGTTIPNTGTWYHIAVCRDANDEFRLYVNGTLEDTATSSVTISTVASTLIGRGRDNSNRYVDGHIDEVRISNIARYTANFTPSTTPFVNDENTLLLLHMDGTDGSTLFEDDNGVRAKVGVTATGNAQVDTAQSKFGGASLLVDGTDDKLQIAKEQLDFINGDEWTVEGWIRRTGGTGSFQQVFGLWSNATATQRSLFIGCDNDASDPEFVVYTYDSGGNIDTSVTSDGGTSIANNTWYHFAVVKDTSNLTLYLNGVSQDSASSTTYREPQIDYSIGSTIDNVLEFAGNIDEIRVSNTARYTTGFTPATSPFVNDENTLLLLHMDGTDGITDFLDDNGQGRAAANFFAAGAAEISTDQSKFGGSSFYCPGAEGDYIQASPRAEFGVGTGDFTIEGWFYTSDNSQNGLIFNNRISATGAPTGGNYVRLLNSKIEWQSGSTAYPSTSTPANDTWHHFAVTRENGSMSLYLNGTRENTWTYTGNFNGNRYISLGEFENGAGAATYTGYIDEIRYSSVARYSGASHAVPTEPFQNDADTIVLLHFDGTDASTVFLDDNGVY